jgi:hypothetical protein
LARRIFPEAVERWAGVGLVVALITMPVAGTALYLMDPFPNPRNVIAFAEVFALVSVIDRRYFRAVVFLLFAIAVHPFMTAFSASFCVLTGLADRWTEVRKLALGSLGQKDPAPVAPAILLALPFAVLFKAPSAAYDLVAAGHRYQFLTRWTWYELLGAIAPPFISWGFARIARARRLRNLEMLSWCMAAYGSIYLVLGLIVSAPHRFEVLSLMQPMRSLQFLYILMLLFGGGLLGRYVLRNQPWRWAALFIPLSAGMCYAQRSLYPATQHIEWPGARSRNPWAQAFTWVRENTPDQAVFAIDPHYMDLRGEDSQGFRAIAERSQLADDGKDSGVVELFPQIGDSWLAQVRAQNGIETFSLDEFKRLERDYGASWVVLRQTGRSDLDCPYRNSAARVCRLP